MVRWLGALLIRGLLSRLRSLANGEEVFAALGQALLVLHFFERFLLVLRDLNI